MGLIPNCFTGECPWCSYSHKPISFGMLAKNTNIEEEQTQADGQKYIEAYSYSDIP